MNDDKQKPAKPAAKPDDAPPKPGEASRDERQPEELTEEDLRLMADTMPGEGPGDD